MDRSKVARFLWPTVYFLGDHFPEHIKFPDFSSRAGKISTIHQRDWEVDPQLGQAISFDHKFKSKGTNNMRAKQAEKNLVPIFVQWGWPRIVSFDISLTTL